MNSIIKLYIFYFSLLLLLAYPLSVLAQESYLPENPVSSSDLKSEKEKELVTEEVSTPEEEGEETKTGKVTKTISKMPERTGNVLLDGFHKVGDWIEDKSGNRFETKWNPQLKDDPSLSSENYGLERDPAQGT